MHGPSDEFLAGSTLTGDEDCTAAPCGSTHEIEYLAHCGTLCDDRIQRVAALQFRAQIAVLTRQPGHIESTADKGFEFVIVERLFDIIERSVAHGRDRRLHSGVRCDQDDRQL